MREIACPLYVGRANVLNKVSGSAVLKALSSSLDWKEALHHSGINIDRRSIDRWDIERIRRGEIKDAKGLGDHVDR